MNSSRALNLTCMHFLLNSSQTLRCHFIFFSPPGYLSSFAVILLPCLLPFLRSTLGHVWKSVCGCVCACVCEHLFFFLSLPVQLCGFVPVHDSQPICMEMKWNGRSCLRKGHFNDRYCWVFMVCCWGFDSVIWPGGDLAILVFSLPFPSLTISLPPAGLHFTSVFSPSCFLSFHLA